MQKIKMQKTFIRRNGNTIFEEYKQTRPSQFSHFFDSYFPFCGAHVSAHVFAYRESLKRVYRIPMLNYVSQVRLYGPTEIWNDGIEFYSYGSEDGLCEAQRADMDEVKIRLTEPLDIGSSSETAYTYVYVENGIDFMMGWV